jgi:hypothetical protein
MKKVIIDTNLWISFLLGHQVQLVRRVLTDMLAIIHAFCQFVVIESEVSPTAVAPCPTLVGRTAEAVRGGGTMTATAKITPP